MGYQLGAEITERLLINGFTPCYENNAPFLKGDIIFGRWALTKINNFNRNELEGISIACPMTNTEHLSQSIHDSPLFVKLNSSHASVKNIRSSGEYTFLLTLMAIKAVTDLSLADYKSKSANRTKQWIYTSSKMLEFKDAVVGFVGMGRNGQTASDMLEALGCRCIYYDPHVDLQLSHRTSVNSLKDVFSGSDCVVLTLTSNESTRHIINLDELVLKHHNLSLINTSRPELIEETSLYRALLDERLWRYLSDFPLLDAELMTLIENSEEIKHRFFWSNHIAGASGRSANLADEIVINQAIALND